MATTAIWKVSSRLDHVLDYVMNIEKTKRENPNKDMYYSLHTFKEYEEMDFTTEEQSLITGINCTPETAYEDMMLTKERFNKKGGILAFHSFQSFKKNEVSPETAHEIGVKLAQEMWGDRFEAIVSTHTNTKITHNHFVVNSVSFVDGKRYYDKRESYAELRHLSDSICQEYGISVLEEKKCKSGINYSNYLDRHIKKDNYYILTKKDIDFAIGQAYNLPDFENIMGKLNYDITYRGNKISVRKKNYKKNIRIERCFGSDYSIERLKERIVVEQATRIPFIEAMNLKNKPFINSYNKKKVKGIYALYLYYCYLLNELPFKQPRKYLPASIRADVYKMETIGKEVILLDKYNLQTFEEFNKFRIEKKELLKNLIDKRNHLWYKHKTTESTEDKLEIIKEINIINTDIKKLREEVKLCEGINDRISSIIENIEEYEKVNKEKGEKKK
ncbi:MAG: relaxase/mobilization nuclease domain-containing protein [Bacilli bacterium]|nr:relaxase/mobilization nuclease domain-containing protein [Bacilli bacterium]